MALNLGDEDSGEVSDYLAQEHGIYTRSGGHCAPLMHEALGTREQGAVRFSFSHFNTAEEVNLGRCCPQGLLTREWIFNRQMYQTAQTAHFSSRISVRAVPLLVWQRTISVPFPTSSRAQRIILCETVLVNSTSRSGRPICLSRLALIWVNTFALQL